MIDIDRKKAFLQQGSELYRNMIALTDSDTVKRYLAFRIIVNAMSFEDLVRERRHPTMRKIRDMLLAHKQESGFFQAFQAVDHITRTSVGELLRFMVGHTRRFDPRLAPLEIKDAGVSRRFEALLRPVLALYVGNYLQGFRLTNNFLAHTGNHIHEMSGGDLAGVFYRYNSSMALFRLAQYIFNNAHEQSDFATSTRHVKLDMILHAQNMADCAIRDRRNNHSIDGLLEVCNAKNLGDPEPLQKLVSDASYQRLYRDVRKVRNGLIGHMDTRASLSDLLTALDQLPIDDVRELVNAVDKAVYDASRPHPALWNRYHSASEPLNDANIIDIPGLKAKRYDDWSIEDGPRGARARQFLRSVGCGFLRCGQGEGTP